MPRGGMGTWTAFHWVVWCVHTLDGLMMLSPTHCKYVVAQVAVAFTHCYEGSYTEEDKEVCVFKCVCARARACINEHVFVCAWGPHVRACACVCGFARVCVCVTVCVWVCGFACAVV